MRSKQLKGIKQGVGQVTKKPFGTVPASQMAMVRHGFNALSPVHMPLPENVGPYTVTRFTQIITSTGPLTFFGFLKGRLDQLRGASDIYTTPEGWTGIIAVGTDDLNTTPSARTFFSPCTSLGNLGSQAQICPAAMTVQIMNPNALQTTNGIVYSGRLGTQFRGRGEQDTWQALANEFVSFHKPRQTAAAQLAMQGVQIDAAPINTNELRDFTRLVDPLATIPGGTPIPWADTSQTSGTTQYAPDLAMKGFQPIVVYNPNGINLQYLVTIEMRVRFDMGHPASSTHKIHHPAPNAWNTAISMMHAAGNGVKDISDVVSTIGQGVSNFRRAIGSFGRAGQLALEVD